MFLLASRSPVVGFTGIVTMLVLLTLHTIVYRLLKMHLRVCGEYVERMWR